MRYEYTELCTATTNNNNNNTLEWSESISHAHFYKIDHTKCVTICIIWKWFAEPTIQWRGAVGKRMDEYDSVRWNKNQRTITMASNSCRMENKSNAIECVAIEFFTSLVDHLAYSIPLNVLHIPKSFMQSGGEKNLVLHFHAPTHSMHTCMHAFNTPARLLAL